MDLHMKRESGEENIIWREICDLYSCGDISSEFRCRRLRWAGHILTRGEECHLKETSFKKSP